MQYEIIRDAIEQLLFDEAHRRYNVVGYQNNSAGLVERFEPTVIVFFKSGNFPESGGTASGANRFDLTFSLDLSVVVNAEGDLMTLQNQNATADQLSSSLESFSNSLRDADRAIDHLFSDVYNVIMDARHEHFKLPKGQVSSRWLSGFTKHAPIDRGESTVLTGSAALSCTVCEQVDGERGKAGIDFDLTLDIADDDVERTGVAGTLGG